MASPLRWFRRNQKTMLIFFGIALMVVFLLPQLFDPGGLGGDGSAAENPKVVEIDGTTLTLTDLNSYRNNHLQAHNILMALQERAYRQRIANDELGNLPQVYDRVPVDSQSPQNLNRIFIRRMLIAKEGRELGIKITDDTVVDYIAFITGRLFDREQKIDAEIRSITNSRFDFAKVRSLIMEDLYYFRTNELLEVGLPLLPNVSRGWEMFNKLNYRIQCDVLELSIDDEIAKITETPSNAELQKIFAEGEYLLRDPSNEKPGFKVGPRLAVGYFEAKFSRFLKAAESDVSPEAVEAEYNRLVEAGDPLVIEVISKSDDAIDLDMGDDGEQPDPPKDDGEIDSNDAPKPPPTDPPDGDDVQPHQQGQETDSDNDRSNPTRDNDSAEQIESEKSGSENRDDPDDSNKSDGEQDDLARLLNDWVAPLIVAGSAQSDTQFISYHPPIDLETEQDQENQDQTTENQQQESQETDQVEVENSGAADPQETGLNSDQEPATVDEEVRIRSLQEVADQIKTRLASVIAEEKLSKAVQEAESEILDFKYDVLRDWEEENEKKPVSEGPKMDAQAIADRHGLTYQSTKLLQLSDFFEEEIATKVVSVQVMDPNSETPREQASLLAAIYLNDFHQSEFYMPKFFRASQPELPGYSYDQYLVWTMDKANVEIRSFSEAKLDVIEFWKRQQAKKRILEKANSIAMQLDSTSLREQFGDEVRETGGFTWLNQTTRSFSMVGGVDKPGKDFMEVAFSLEKGEAGVAVNYDNTAAYVIVVTSTDERDQEAMQQEFFSSYSQMMMLLQFNIQIPMPLLTHHQEEIRVVFSEWDEYLAKKYKLKWIDQ